MPKDMWVCFWIPDSVPLIYTSTLMSVSQCLHYRGFPANLKVKLYKLSNLVLFKNMHQIS